MQYLPVRPKGKSDSELSLFKMKLKPSLLLFSFIGILGIAFFLTENLPFKKAESNPKRDAALMEALLHQLESVHFQPKAIDDNLSKQVYGLYMKDIDGNKRFFTAEDIDKLSVYEKKLDDEAQAGTFEFFDLSVDLMDKALDKTASWSREILAKPMDFSKNEMLESDGDKLSWAKNDNELRQRWEKLLKYEVLSRVVDAQTKQDKPDFKGDKKDQATIEKEQRDKVLDIYEKWFKRLKTFDRDHRMEIYLNSFTNVFDPHSGYFTPQKKEDFDIDLSGKLEGIGASLLSDGEKTSVSEIVPGGPAWKQGLLEPKDVILKVAQGETDAESVDIMGWNISDVVHKIRGPKGTKVTLTIQKPDGSQKIITITRDVVIMEERFAKSLILSSDKQPENKIGYIYLPSFYVDFSPSGTTSCAADVQKEVAKLKAEQVKGIILDLRGNPGGSLRDVVQMSGLFIEEGPIVQVKSRNRKPEIMNDYDSRVQWGGPLVVMVNGSSASASEILAAAMQDYGRAVIVGAAGTYGKGTVQRFYDLDMLTSDESVKPLGQTKLTMQKFYRVTGKTTQLDGVTPDIVLPDFYNLVDRGERENDYPLESTTIDPVPFNQSAYHIADLEQLKKNSASRVNADETFKKVSENASRLRKLKDQTMFPLEMDKYVQWDKRQEEEASRYDNIFSPIADFGIQNLSADLPQIQQDTSRMARNDTWIQARKKDIQLYETVQIMEDMVKMDALAANRH